MRAEPPSTTATRLWIALSSGLSADAFDGTSPATARSRTAPAPTVRTSRTRATYVGEDSTELGRDRGATVQLRAVEADGASVVGELRREGSRVPPVPRLEQAAIERQDGGAGEHGFLAHDVEML